MSTATIAKHFRFEASHQLPHHDGKCARPHGHSYRAAVQITGPIIEVREHPEEGMVMDFAKLDAAWKELEDRLDHRDLNESIGHLCGATTAENIAKYILDELTARFPEGPARISAVTLWETATSSATVRA